MNPHAAQIYIDGSCLKNPGGPGGIAGVLVMPTGSGAPKTIFQEGYKQTTNNLMEMKALIAAMEYVADHSKVFRSSSVTMVDILSDSEIAIKCYHNAERWRANNWRNDSNAPVRNVSTLKRICSLKASARFPFHLEHIIGKSTEHTKLVDRLAKEAANRGLLEIDHGYIVPKFSKSSIRGTAALFAASGQRVIVRVFEHAPITRRKDSLYKIKFEALSDPIGKFYAHATSDINSLIDRQHFYEVQFNHDPMNPMMMSIKEIDAEEITG